MNDTVVRARVESALKNDAEKVFAELGLTTTEAIRMFLAQVKMRGGLPFALRVAADNDDLLVTNKMRQAALDSIFDD